MFAVRPEQKSPTETGASDCCSSDSRPNSRASSIDIRLSGRGAKSGEPVDVDSDDGNEFESDAQKGGSSGSGATTSSPQGTPGSKSGMTVSSQSSNMNGGTSKRKKKTRTVFSRSQVFQLESTFDVKRYLSSSERAGLAASLHLTETQVRSFDRFLSLTLTPSIQIISCLQVIIRGKCNLTDNLSKILGRSLSYFYTIIRQKTSKPNSLLISFSV